MTLPIADIVVGARHRQDLGDVAGLARDIEAVGLLHSIVVTPDNRLIAGGRRLAACRQLGWTEVPVRVVDLVEIVRGEFSENAHRKDFLPSEIDAIRRAMAPAVAEAATSRKLSGRSAPDKGETRDKVGAFAGVSGKQVAKIAAVVDAAKSNPERFGPLVEEMDRKRKVDGAWRKLQRELDGDRIRDLVPIAGKFRTLVVDPPWKYDTDLAGRAVPTYKAMTHEELLALPVADWAEDRCHLYLWFPNSLLMRAGELMARWGFVPKTILTWLKPKFGMGSYFRGSTEHVLFGVRGRLTTRSDSIGTDFEADEGLYFEAPVGKLHSEKPERFYEIVRAASYGPFGEAFQRKARPDFTNLYELRPAAEAAE